MFVYSIVLLPTDIRKKKLLENNSLHNKGSFILFSPRVHLPLDIFCQCTLRAHLCINAISIILVCWQLIYMDFIGHMSLLADGRETATIRVPSFQLLYLLNNINKKKEIVQSLFSYLRTKHSER